VIVLLFTEESVNDVLPCAWFDWTSNLTSEGTYKQWLLIIGTSIGSISDLGLATINVKYSLCS
jgi:hypothetical protein